MKITGVIPARYKSSRFEGKPLADIDGKPMIWWVYQRVAEVTEFDDVLVATDDDRIADVCKQYGMKCLMTSEAHRNHVERLYEVSTQVDSDLYVIVCGDEPLMHPETIKRIIPDSIPKKSHFACGIMREFTDPVETIDPANIKIATNKDGYCVFLSRNPIPYPYKSLDFTYKKIVGVECYNKTALDFFYHTEPGPLEKIEDVVLLRFIENFVQVKYILDDKYTLAVDTPKDLEKVKKIMGV